MPIINIITSVENVDTKEKVQIIIEGFTKVAMDTMPGIPKSAFTVVVKPVPNKHIGFGGFLLTDILMLPHPELHFPKNK